MPCQSDPSDYADNSIRNELNMVTRLLCALCGELEAAGQSLYIGKVPYLLSWWEAHKLRDAERKVREAKQAENDRRTRQALDKLTPEERVLLGLQRK